MEWTADVGAGAWIADRLDPDWRSMHHYVPRGFPAYARIFHPPVVSWVDGRAHPTAEELRETPPHRLPEIHSSPTTWAETAAVFGTTLHATAQWNRVVRAAERVDPAGAPTTGDWRSVIGPDGREYAAPDEGMLDAAQTTTALAALAPHTTTPSDVFVSVWEGWGGIVGGLYDSSPSVAVLTDDPVTYVRHAEMLERSIHDPFNNVFRRPEWRSGVLSDEISRGPRLRLPDRDHVLFRGRLGEFDDDWPSRVPWSEGASRWTASPSLIWPADRAWVLVTEIDADSTIVGGAPEAIRAVCTDPRLEALALREGADLSWDADEENR